jgi:integration host factor subunit beta
MWSSARRAWVARVALSKARPCKPIPKLCKATSLGDSGGEGSCAWSDLNLFAKLVGTYPHLTPRDSEIIVATIFGEIAPALSRDNRVELRGLGTFSVRQRDARIGRNPRSGEKVGVPAKRFPYFRTGTLMTERLNGRAKGKRASLR